MKLEAYLQSYQSTILGTVSEDGYPFTSYAPFFYDGCHIYILISDIATHSKNIQKEWKASAFFIEDEKTCHNIFARKRISLQCDVRMITREDTQFGIVKTAFGKKFNQEMITMLTAMKDFNFYELTPARGEATFGFGEAYAIGGEEMNELIPRSVKGHR
ncbi:MAG: pyridoxamine 5'-phosphate oxidase family protein [Campylobacterales bacterium]|nr:pyridoxamine 5'-phosphate oxidase family protein [Campylobacterales bacterium]